jgi:methylated-DNA-[protein]-cysteine S-methyltransferase
MSQARTTGYWSTVDTTAGPFTVVVDGDGVVLGSGFTDDLDALLCPVPEHHRNDLGHATKAVRDYFGGDLGAVDTVPVRQHSNGHFLATAWETLRTVPAGASITYTEFAAKAGNPTAVRAAAQACARNAAALFVPCHRVVRSDGSLGGFRWGLPVKRWLLDHETASQPGDKSMMVNI